MNLGAPELLLILAVILLLVGARRLPEIGKALGQAVKEFQNAFRGKSEDGDHHKEQP